MTRALVGVCALVTLAGCATHADGTRMLPTDRTAVVGYVALGDSTVEGVGATSPLTTYVARLQGRLRDLYPNARAVNLGAAGAMSAHVLAYQVDPTVALQPALVTLSIGPNDITGGVPVDEYARNVNEIFGRLRRETRAVVVANLLPDLAVTPRFRGTPEEREVAVLTAAFNAALTAAARRHGVELVDLYGPSRIEVPASPDLVASDGYHPSDAGYARWAELVWAGVQRRVPPRP